MKIEYRRLDVFVVENESGQKFIRISKNIWTDGSKILNEKERRGLEVEFRENVREDFWKIIVRNTQLKEFKSAS